MQAELLAGGLASVAGLLVFLVVHQVWISPIWNILPVGLVIGWLGGMAVGWSYHELRSALPGRPFTASAVCGLVGITLLPAIILGQFRPALIDPSTFTIPAGTGGRVAIRVLLELVLT